MAQKNAIGVPQDDWQTEDDLRIICRAKEIMKDTKRMAKVRALAKSKMMDMASVAGEEKKL